MRFAPKLRSDTCTEPAPIPEPSCGNPELPGTCHDQHARARDRTPYVASIAIANRNAGAARTETHAPAAAGHRLIDDRNRALLGVAYDAMLSRSELTELAVADLTVEDHGGATLLVRHAKTDPEGAGSSLYLARNSVALAMRWLKRGGLADGRPFRSVSKAGRLGARLDPSQIPHIFKAMACAAGLFRSRPKG